jgi:hypothetical protein
MPSDDSSVGDALSHHQSLQVSRDDPGREPGCLAFTAYEGWGAGSGYPVG